MTRNGPAHQSDNPNAGYPNGSHQQTADTGFCADHAFRESILDLFRVGSRKPESVFQSNRVHSGGPDPQYDMEQTGGATTGEYLDWLDREVLPNAVNLSSPLCAGHMAGPVPAFAPELAALAASLNQNLVKRDASRSLTALERRTVAVLHRLVFGNTESFYGIHAQEPESTLGVIGSGGTIANLTALWIARNSCFPPSVDFAGVDQAGMAATLAHHEYDGAVIVGSEMMHYSICKAASLLGLGSKEVVMVPVDAENRMDIDALGDCLASCAAARKRVLAVVATGGSTDCGSVDPIGRIAPFARAAGAFFHVDAAWGGPLLFSRAHRSLLSGIEEADSVAFDAHKQMYLPVASSVLLLRNPAIAALIECRSHYMLHDGSGDLGCRSLEGSRGGGVLMLDAALAIIGTRGYEFLIDENLRKAQSMARLIRARRDFELLFEPAMNVVLYRHLPEQLCFRDPRRFTAEDNRFLNAFNEELQKRQSAAGRTYVSRTTVGNTIHGRREPIRALRAVIANPLIEERHMEALLSDQATIGAALAGSQHFAAAH